MIIGVDGRELEGKPTGVGVYLRNILKRVQLPAGVSMQIFFRREIPDLSGITAEAVLVRGAKTNLVWQQWTLVRELKHRKIPIFFSPANAGPWNYSGFNILTVHDFSFFRYPQWFSTRERISRQFNTSISLKHADRIYVVSPLMREELVMRFELPYEKVLVTENGVTERGQGRNRVELRQKYGHSAQKLLLYVGSIFNRRHLPVLILTMRELDPSYHLVVIGENRTHPKLDLDQIARGSGVSDRVTFLSFASEEVVDDYYAMADLFIYLSDYEGFGIPPLEAMSAGVPVITSARSSLGFIFKGAARFVDTNTVEALRKAVMEIGANPSEQEHLKSMGKALSQHYTWERTARIVQEDWEQIIASRS